MAGGYSAAQYLAPDARNGGTIQVRVGGTEVQGPDVKCRAALIKAAEGNAGIVYFNWKTGIKVLQTAEDALVGFPLGAGDDGGWVPTGGNLENIYLIASAADQDVVIMYLV